MTITVDDYRPSPALDEELAALGYTGIQGWPDQAPVDASLARAMLRPAGMTATTLLLHRDDDGRLLAGAAVRWPATLDSTGRLWGPVVQPDARGHGLGRSLMLAIGELLARRPGVLISTTEIPESRKVGWALFVDAGWDSAGIRTLYQRPVDPFSPAAAPDEVAVRPLATGEYVAPGLADLFAASRPELGPTTARDTFARWSADSRYRAEGLLLAEHDGRLIGAAIVYPSSSDRPDEPAEALLLDLLVAADLPGDQAEAVRRSLIRGALGAAAAMGMTVARSVVDSEALAADLMDAGFTVVDRLFRYTHRAG
jgi:GNAT superfamily N-acetyltransferase